MQKRITIVAVVLSGALAATHVLSFDGLGGIGWSLCLPDDTTFAPMYSALGFLRVHAKMNREEVRGLLGEPFQIRVDDAQREYWLYARSASGTNYRVRTVVFGADGLVVQRISEFYVD